MRHLDNEELVRLCSPSTPLELELHTRLESALALLTETQGWLEEEEDRRRDAELEVKRLKEDSGFQFKRVEWELEESVADVANLRERLRLLEGKV